jgi:hypothetical protein
MPGPIFLDNQELLDAMIAAGYRSPIQDLRELF